MQAIEFGADAKAENRVVITKDADFVNSFTLSRKPYKLLLISTGNISNAELDALFVTHAQALPLRAQPIH